MRKLLIYLICGLMTLGVFIPVALKAADSNETTSPGEEKLYGVQFKLIKTNGSMDNIGSLKDYVSLSNPEMPTLKEDFLNLFNSTDTNTFNPRFICRSYTFGHAFDIEYYTVKFKNGRKIIDLSDIKELKSDDLNPNAPNLLIWVHAKIKNGYKVYFDFKNGEEGFTTETAFASKVKESPKVPTREGYKFLGWYDGDKIFRIEKDFIYEDTTLTAKWEKENFDKYKVSFVLEGSNIPSQEVEFDTQAAEPKVDPKEGFEFDGWYTDSEFKNKFDFSSPVKSDMILYAKWAKKKYTVSFMLEGENIPNQEVKLDSQATEPTVEVKEGFEFDGWYTDSEFKKKFNFSSPIKSKLTLYARWEKKKYTVSFVLEGEEISNQNVEFDSQATEPTVETKEGFEFDGWYTDPGFTKKFDFSSPIKSKLTLYARWEKKKYTVSFVLEGSYIPSQEVEFDTNAAEPKVETREGFEFDGWYTDPGFTKKFNFSSPVKSNLNLYARWNKIEKENPNPDEKEEPGENPNPDDNKNPGETEEPGKNPDQNPGEDQEPGDDKDTDENPDEDKDPDESEEPGNNPDEKEKPGETEEPGKDEKENPSEKENPDQDKNPDDNKESDDQKNPDIKDKPNNNDRPSYDYYDYYDYYRRPNYDYVNPNRNNSSDIAKNKDDKDEEKTKDENKEEIIEEKVTIPEAILNSYFSDIGDLPGHYQEAIIDLANRSVLIGTGKNNFDPHTSISRAMVAQVLYRLANDKAYVNPSDFTDSAPTNWFYTAVNWANEKGLVEGFKDKTFKPNKSITNEELAVILARAIEKLELKTSKINSIDKGDYKFLADWNRDGIIKMLELDLMDFTFENNQVVVKEISRAEFANIIYKLINSLN